MGFVRVSRVTRFVASGRKSIGRSANLPVSYRLDGLQSVMG